MGVGSAPRADGVRCGDSLSPALQTRSVDSVRSVLWVKIKRIMRLNSD